MLDRQAIYQRTDLGRQEIRHKSHGLTQSERLILILVDGIGELDTIRSRLQGLTDERFDRAVRKLQASHLIEQVLLQLDSPIIEEIEDDVANRFLRQDPLDPVTIISFEPEEEFPLPPPSASDHPALPPNITPAIGAPAYVPIKNKVPDPGAHDRQYVVQHALATGESPSIAKGSRVAEHAEPGSTIHSTHQAIRTSAQQSAADVNDETFAWYYWLGLLVMSVLTSAAILAW